jgi:hypothetical protein
VRVRGGVRVRVRVCMINAGMPDRPASSQSGTGLKKLTMPEQVRYRTKLTQSGIFFSPVPDFNSGCRNADAGVSFLDADAQLWQQPQPTKGIGVPTMNIEDNYILTEITEHEFSSTCT